MRNTSRGSRPTAPGRQRPRQTQPAEPRRPSGERVRLLLGDGTRPELGRMPSSPRPVPVPVEGGLACENGLVVGAILDQRAGEGVRARGVSRASRPGLGPAFDAEGVARGRAWVGCGLSVDSRITCRTACMRSGCTGQRWWSCACCNKSRTADDSAHTRCTKPCRSSCTCPTQSRQCNPIADRTRTRVRSMITAR
jgi:hypothetical protein